MRLSLGVLAGLLTAGCGGSSGGGQGGSPQPPPSSPPTASAYSVLVTGAGNGITHNAQITVTVQSSR